jgi:hypothetical protein
MKPAEHATNVPLRGARVVAVRLLQGLDLDAQRVGDRPARRSAHHIFLGEDAIKVGAPADAFESTAIEWIPLADVPSLIAKRDIVSTSTMAALLLLACDGRSRTDTNVARTRSPA